MNQSMNECNLNIGSFSQVYKSFKGSSQENIEIITLGGTVGNDRLVVNPALKLNKGEIGIFMLHESTVNTSQNSKIFNQFYEVVSLKFLLMTIVVFYIFYNLASLRQKRST